MLGRILKTLPMSRPRKVSLARDVSPRLAEFRTQSSDVNKILVTMLEGP